MSLDDVLGVVAGYPTRLVEVTGGEPLEHEEVYPLMDALLEKGYTVMLETGGHVNIGRVPKPVIKVVDIKCPDSGESEKNCLENLKLVQPHDEFKFVISSRRDYDWSREFVFRHLKRTRNPVLFSPAHGVVAPIDLSQWILEDGLPARLQLQLHKYIWGPETRGV